MTRTFVAVAERLVRRFIHTRYTTQSAHTLLSVSDQFAKVLRNCQLGDRGLRQPVEASDEVDFLSDRVCICVGFLHSCRPYHSR